jgi:hypothetical protein
VDVGAFAGNGDGAAGGCALTDGIGLVRRFTSRYSAGYVSGGVDALDVEDDQTDRPDAQQE